MTYTSVFGPLTGREQVEQQALNVFRNPPQGGDSPLIVYFLAEVERQRGLQPRTIPPPPSVDSYRGGVDFENWTQPNLPQIIVACQPTGDAERYDGGAYGQWFEIQIAGIVIGRDEDTARQLADWYGAAIMGLITQPAGSGLGTRVDPGTGSVVPFAEKTVLITAPRTEFLPNRENTRQLAQSVTVVHSFVQQVAQEQGPTAFPPDPYTPPQPWPTVTKVTTQLRAEDPLGNFSAGTGVSVTTPDGAVTVTE